MSKRKTIVVGYGAAGLASLQTLRPSGSVIVIEEPDVIRKRRITEALDKLSVVQRLYPAEYQTEDNAEQIFESLQGLEVESVVPLVEYATPCAARLAELFGVPGAGYAASLKLRNKGLLRDVSSAGGIRNPRFTRAASLADAQRLAQEVDGPIVVKPSNRQGSVGVVVASDIADLGRAWRASMVRDEGDLTADRGIPKETLVEEFIFGAEYSVEALIRDGQMLFSNVTEKELFGGPNPVERGHIVPARLPAAEAAMLIDNTKRLVDVVGFQTGIIHCEWILKDGQPHLVECAGRFAGDGIIDLIERAYGYELVAAYHALMRGASITPPPSTASKTAVVRFIGGQDATIRSIDIDPEALSQPGVCAHQINVRPGDRVTAPTSSWARLGSVTVEATDPVSATALAHRALDGVSISYVEERAA